jgi:hypothetical protein
MCHLIISSGLVVLAAVNAAGPSRVSTIAKQLVIFDLVNKFFQQVSLFHMVNMLLYEVVKQRVLLCYGQQLSRNEVGTPSVGKEMPISRIVVAVPNATVVLLD